LCDIVDHVKDYWLSLFGSVDVLVSKLRAEKESTEAQVSQSVL